MKILEIIKKKNNKEKLSPKEICFAVDGYMAGCINKLNMTNFLKAIYLNGMDEDEIFALTKCMLNSGDVLNFKNKNKVYADKHSTGGISDTTTLIITPIIACADINFFKMSGSQLGFTGGTIDKLLCFKGYKTDISFSKAEKLLNKNGAVLMSSSEKLVPADKYIYQLRDETNLIMSIPLIASSVMSKKLAQGSDIILLDVKCGDGAFMKDKKSATELAKLMIKIGETAGKKTTAVISDMNQPLGTNIGSFMETIEAINVLKGKDKNSRLRELSIYLSAKIIELGKNIPFSDAELLATKLLDSGKALKKFKRIIKAQEGSLDLFSDKKIKKILKDSFTLNSKKQGYLSKLDMEKLGFLTRKYCSDGNYGITLLVSLGDYVEKDEAVIELYGKKTDIDFLSCLHYSKNKKITTKLIIDVL